MSKYIIDIPKTVGMGKVGSVHYTYFDGIQVQTIVLKGDEIEELNSDYINEHYSDLQDEAYNKGYAQCQDDYSDALKHAKDTAYKKGLEDGNAQIELGCEGCKHEGISRALAPCHYCTRNSTDYWTAKQTDDEIKVGDEVETKDGKRFVVTTFGSGLDGDIAVGVCADGLGLGVDLKELHKTGRHFDISSILEAMQS